MIDVHFRIVLFFTICREVFINVEDFTVEVVVEVLEDFLHTSGREAWRMAEFMAQAKE